MMRRLPDNLGWIAGLISILCLVVFLLPFVVPLIPAPAWLWSAVSLPGKHLGLTVPALGIVCGIFALTRRGQDPKTRKGRTLGWIGAVGLILLVGALLAFAYFILRVIGFIP